MPLWVIYNLPDALWLFSYLLYIDAIWSNSFHNSLYKLFFWSIPIFSILLEFLQLANFIPGTFDIVDIMFYIISVLLVLIIDYHYG